MFARFAWLSYVVVVACGCVADVSGLSGDAGTDASVSGSLVTAPSHGAVVEGDPVGLSVHVAGVYADATHALDVQVLANPDDLTTWTSIGTTHAAPAATGFEFSLDVQPVATADDSARWPAGGVLRLRVVDDTGVALPHDLAAPADTVLAIVNPAGVPATWTYLTEKPVGSPTETAAYYAAINAPATLADFQALYQMTPASASDIAARYYNAGDLGIGREMHCRATATPVGGVACYVMNYGTFGGTRDDALAQLAAGTTPLATVVMVYTPPLDAPNAVTFMVYGPTGALSNLAQLDTHGDNTSIPQNCLNCHGGRSKYDATTHAATGARFLPFDPAAFEFSSDPTMTLAAQTAQFRSLDGLVSTTEPTTAMRELISGMWPPGGAFDDAFVPSGWSATPSDAQVYRGVVAPYCRSCHTTFDRASDTATFATAAGLRAQKGAVLTRLCGAGPHGMPTAERTTAALFGSSARALLLTWLEAPGACAP